jgi:hypothetical protein
MSALPPSTFAADAYRACLIGQATHHQQQSAAGQIALLTGSRAELLDALIALHDVCRLQELADESKRPTEEQYQRTLARAWANIRKASQP